MYFADVPDRVFTATSNISPEIVITQPGDKISITFLETREPLVPVEIFDNEEFSIRTSAEQSELDARRGGLESEQEARSTVKDVREELQNLSQEELLELQRILKSRQTTPPPY